MHQVLSCLAAVASVSSELQQQASADMTDGQHMWRTDYRQEDMRICSSGQVLGFDLKTCSLFRLKIVS